MNINFTFALCIFLCTATVEKSVAKVVYQRTDKSTYAGHSTPVDFDSAVKTCTDSNGTLLIPQSFQDIINNLVHLERMPAESWIYATRGRVEGTWESNGIVLAFFNWDSNQPDSSSSTLDCVYYKKSSLYKWSTADCSSSKPFVCKGVEIPNIPTTEPNVKTTSQANDIITTQTSEVGKMTFQSIFKDFDIMLNLFQDSNDISKLIATVERIISLQLAHVAFESNFRGVLEKRFPGIQLKVVNATDVNELAFVHHNKNVLDISLESNNLVILIAYQNDLEWWNAFANQQKTRKFITEKEISLLPVNGSIFHIASYKKTNGTVYKTKGHVNFTISLEQDYTVLKYLHDNNAFLQGGVERMCAALSLSTEMWEDAGCKIIAEDVSKISCNCEHATTFSGVLSFNVITISEDVSYMLTGVQIISILFLAITLVFYLVSRRRLRKDRSFTQIYLTLSLLFLNVVMYVSREAIDVPVLCIVTTALTHYFLMTSFCWMFNHGYILYIKTCENPLGFNMGKYTLWLHVIGWGVPGVIAAICAAVAIPTNTYIANSENHDFQISKNITNFNFPQYRSCWLSTESLVNLSAIVPVCLIMSANFAILAKVSYVVWKLSKSSENYLPSSGCRLTPQQWDNVMKGLKAFATLAPILGVTWIFGFFVNVPNAEEIFVVIQSMFNGAQCLALLLFFAILNPDVQPTAIRRYRERSRIRRQATISGDTKFTNVGSRRLQTVSVTVG